jgi:hypothetical protein
MRIAGLFLAILLVAGCAAAPPYEETGQASEQAVTTGADEQLSGVDVDAIANCVRNNASDDELAILVAGDDASTRLTADILGRAPTQQCIADNNVALPEAS